MDDCIFCNIVKGDLPAYKVYEDDQFLGFLDIHPLNPGNSLLIPKGHNRWVYDVEDFGKYFEIAKRIALATQEVVGSHSINFLTLGYEVPHAHIRIIPRFDNDGHTGSIDIENIKDIDDDEMKRISEEIFRKLI